MPAKGTAPALAFLWPVATVERSGDGFLQRREDRMRRTYAAFDAPRSLPLWDARPRAENVPNRVCLAHWGALSHRV